MVQAPPGRWPSPAASRERLPAPETSEAAREGHGPGLRGLGFRVFRVRGLGVQVFLDLGQFRVRGLGLFWIRCEVHDEFSGFRAGGVGQDVALKPVDHTRIKHSGLF